MPSTLKKRITESLSDPTNGAADQIALTEPYTVEVELTGVCPLIFHRWNCESVAEKAGAAKGSAAKKTDDIESYVWRDEDNRLCIPGSYLQGAIVNAAKFRQDPRSPRKSAMDLYKAGVVCLTDLAPLGAKTWDFLDKRRAVVQRNAITRVRPAMKAGWKTTFVVMVNTPEYIGEVDLRDTVQRAGKLIGLADHRPTYGRYDVTRWKRLL